jgi:hypothetical protein
MLAVFWVNALGIILNLLKPAVLIMPTSLDVKRGGFFALVKKMTLFMVNCM